MLKKLRTYLVSGLLIVVPVSVTIYIIYHLFTYFDTILKPILEPALETIGLFYVNGMGLIILLLFLLFIGMLASNWFGQRLLTLGNNIINKIPLVNKIYKATQQISFAVIGRQKSIFRGVVLVEYPRKEMYSLGFWTETSAPEIAEKLNEKELYHIFIPTTPNPTSGYLLILPKKDIIFLEMSVEEALKMIISGGSVVPGREKESSEDEEEINKKEEIKDSGKAGLNGK
ncbi:MAG: DUF502 domain-containing protein [bacterium]|nr:DUF502 domain-containing protein [bacterium]